MKEIALPIRTRPLQPSDAGLAATWMKAEWPVPPRLAKGLNQWLAAMIAEDRIRGGCIEELMSRSGDWTTAAIGLSTFVPDGFVDAYLAAPSPFPALKVLERARRGERDLLLSSAEIGRGNAGGGLNQLTVYYGQSTKDPADPAWRRILPASHKLHREVHGGYRMRRLLQDEWTKNEPVFVYAGYKVLARFEAGTPGPVDTGPLAAPRSLVSLTADDVAGELPGTTASFLFEYQPPVLRLTTAERRLLVHATAGMTDEEIAAALQLSTNTLKSTWRQIYARFERFAPFVFRREGGGETPRQRGPEKRRRVLAYVDEHPQELRPYDWT